MLKYDSAVKFLANSRHKQVAKDDDVVLDDDDVVVLDEDDDVIEIGDNECSLLTVVEKEVEGSVAISRNYLRSRVPVSISDDKCTVFDYASDFHESIVKPEDLLQYISALFDDAFEVLNADLNSGKKKLFECGSLTLRLTRAVGSSKHSVYAATCTRVRSNKGFSNNLYDIFMMTFTSLYRVLWAFFTTMERPIK